MIIGLLLTILLNFVNFIVARFPISGLSSDISVGINNFIQSAYAYNSILPIDTALTVIGWTLGFWALILLWDISRWIIHLIRGN